MSDIERVEARLSDLEYRLERYLESQREALERQSQFQLNATWGLLRGLGGIGFFAAPGFAAHYIAKWFGAENWLTWGAGIVVGLVAWYLYAGYVERGYEDDLKKLGELPEAPQFPAWRD